MHAARHNAKDSSNNKGGARHSTDNTAPEAKRSILAPLRLSVRLCLVLAY
jgi:hypothetical protein